MHGLLSRFARDERAAVTIEFVLWIPIIVALLTIAIDATALYITHTEMWNVARDTARRITSGKIQSEAEAEAYAVQAMSLRDFTYLVDVEQDPNGTTWVALGLWVKDMSIIGYGSPLTIFGGLVNARVVMRPDPRIPWEPDTSDDGTAETQ